jgi:hypothetical protein
MAITTEQKTISIDVETLMQMADRASDSSDDPGIVAQMFVSRFLGFLDYQDKAIGQELCVRLGFED